MYRVMIVEDELIVREWLCQKVNWAGFNLEVCAEAANGRNALALFEEKHPDIIITDIRMPIMDGIELMRQVRKKDQRVRFLVLTCLDEFALVKQAIDLDATSYILKLTSKPDEIERELLKAKNYLKLVDGSAETGKNREQEQGYQNQRLASAENYLKDHYTEEISILEVAEHVGVTPNYLGKLFLKYKQNTFKDELNRLRIKAAKDMMADPACRIYEVAEKVGFSSTTYFFRVFKKYEGCTPTEWRTRGVVD